MADALTPSRLAALRELAEKATPGPWYQDDCFVHSRPMSDACDEYLRKLRKGEVPGEDRDNQTNRPETLVAYCEQQLPNSEEDADYIAACDPQTVLALLDEVERLRAENEHLSNNAGHYRALSVREEARAEKAEAALFIKQVAERVAARPDWQKGAIDRPANTMERAKKIKESDDE